MNDDDDELDHEDVDIPDPNQHEARTTASEFDGAQNEAEDEANIEDLEVNDGSDEGGSADEQKNVKNITRLNLPKPSEQEKNACLQKDQRTIQSALDKCLPPIIGPEEL